MVSRGVRCGRSPALHDRSRDRHQSIRGSNQSPTRLVLEAKNESLLPNKYCHTSVVVVATVVVADGDAVVTTVVVATGDDDGGEGVSVNLSCLYVTLT